MPNKIYGAPETAITFRDSGGDVVITLQNLAFGAGRVSAQYDRGAGSKARKHTIKGVFQHEASPVVGEVVEMYLIQSDGTYVDGTVGTVDAALTTDKRRNLMVLGTVNVDVASGGVDFVATFQEVIISARYYSIGVWNASAAKNLKNTANSSRIIVTPDPPEIQ